ncbi:hypothetical protein [Pseudomonas sp.]|uniref:hypothetical protein n=1 Tax=Pseudomonas sp. TaxID=306 RepID=UPI003A97EDA8
MNTEITKPRLNRLPLTSTISMEKICSNRDIVNDEIFLKKYLRLINGEKQALLTRISLKNIKNGFYKRADSEFTGVTDIVPEEDIAYVKDLIRSGHRPQIYVYKNINKAAPEAYVAPDDSAVYQAYAALKIEMAPVVVLETSIELEESAYEVRHLKFKEENLGVFLDSTVAKKETGKAHSILGKNISARHTHELEKLHAHASKLAEEVKMFHSSYIPGLHYHQTLFSILYRLSENLQAIKLLINNNYYFQAVCLLRSTYEISLDFYVDWLAPEQIGFWLQVHAKVDRAGFNTAMELAHPQENTKKSKLLIEKKSYCYNLLSNVSNKANLSPLGKTFYDEIYTFSSEVIHQDFNMTEIYSILMENPNSETFNEKATTTLIRCLDLITAKICHRIRQDIGVVN